MQDYKNFMQMTREEQHKAHVEFIESEFEKLDKIGQGLGEEVKKIYLDYEEMLVSDF